MNEILKDIGFKDWSQSTMVLAVPILSVVSDIARGFKLLLRKNSRTLCVIITIPANQIVVSQTVCLLIEVLMGEEFSKYVLHKIKSGYYKHVAGVQISIIDRYFNT